MLAFLEAEVLPPVVAFRELIPFLLALPRPVEEPCPLPEEEPRLLTLFELEALDAVRRVLVSLLSEFPRDAEDDPCVLLEVEPRLLALLEAEVLPVVWREFVSPLLEFPRFAEEEDPCLLLEEEPRLLAFREVEDLPPVAAWRRDVVSLLSSFPPRWAEVPRLVPPVFLAEEALVVFFFAVVFLDVDLFLAVVFLVIVFFFAIAIV